MTALGIITLDGTLVVSSESVAAGSGVEHRAVLQLIENNLADFQDFGRVAFEMRTFTTAGGVQSRRVALLNEQQATLLMTFQRNTEQVRAFKKALVRAFFEVARPAAPAPIQLNAGLIKQLNEAVTYLLESNEQVTARAVAAEEDLSAIQSSKGLPVRNFVRKYFPDARETDIFNTLYAKHMLIHDPRGRWSEKQQKYVPGPTHMHPYAMGKKYFELAEELDRDKNTHLKTRVRRSAEQDLVGWLEAHGFTSNREPARILHAVSTG